MIYNEIQQQVIDSDNHNILVTSPAGSGKTSTLVGAIHRHAEKYPKHHIVGITFTKKAAAELVSRIKNPSVEVSTIHSWAYRRLNNLSYKYNFHVDLLEDATIQQILKKLAHKQGHFYLNQFQLFSFVMGNYNIDVSDQIKSIFASIGKKYILYKEANHLYDFTDLPQYLYDVLQEYGETIQGIDALFVDEFQDVDPIQLKLFNMVECEKRVYIGDPAQSIYMFRGAVEEIFEELSEYENFNLNVNYRSKQEIIDYATTVRAVGLDTVQQKNTINVMDVGGVNASAIICERGAGANLYLMPDYGLHIVLATNDEGVHKANTNLLIAQLTADPKTQVLCRSNREVKRLQTAGLYNVSTIHQAKGLEYNNVVLVNFTLDNLESVNIAYVGLTRAKNNLCVIDFNKLLSAVVNNGESAISKPQQSKTLF